MTRLRVQKPGKTGQRLQLLSESMTALMDTTAGWCAATHTDTQTQRPCSTSSTIFLAPFLKLPFSLHLRNCPRSVQILWFANHNDCDERGRLHKRRLPRKATDTDLLFLHHSLGGLSGIRFLFRQRLRRSRTGVYRERETGSFIRLVLVRSIDLILSIL